MQIAEANKVLIPAITAVKFPDLNVNHSNGKTMKLPIRISDVAVDADKSSIPKASLVCLSFRSNSWVIIYTVFCKDMISIIYVIALCAYLKAANTNHAFLKWLINLMVAIVLILLFNLKAELYLLAVVHSEGDINIIKKTE